MTATAQELIRARMARTGESEEVAAHALAMKCKPESRAHFGGASIVSRIQETGRVIQFAGKSFRVTTKTNGE